MYVQGNVVRNDKLKSDFIFPNKKFKNLPLKFSQDLYISQIDNIGLKNTWRNLINFLLKNGIEKFNSKIVNFYDIGKLYEIGLAYENKFDKKQCGKYYTPKDVSTVMAKMLCQNKNLGAIADVGCGCGNLIIAVLEELEKTKKLENALKNGIYLFDNDETALEICSARIQILFNIEKEKIHKICGDFLTLNELPENLSVISNPPYVSNCHINSRF